MAKMKDRNAQLKSALGGMATKERIVESQNLPAYDAKNKQGFDAYAFTPRLYGMSAITSCAFGIPYRL